MQQILTVEQVAGYFGKSPRTIRTWIASGKLAARKVGKAYVITSASIDRLVGPAELLEERNVHRHAAVRGFLDLMAQSKATLSDLKAFQEEEIELEYRGKGTGS